MRKIRGEEQSPVQGEEEVFRILECYYPRKTGRIDNSRGGNRLQEKTNRGRKEPAEKTG